MMKKLLFFRGLCFLLCLLTVSSGWAASPLPSAGLPVSGSSKTAYGILLFDQGAQTNQIVSFPIPNVTQFTTIRPFGSTYISAGAWFNEKYYYSTVGMISGVAETFCSIDLETAEVKQIATLSGFSNKISDMTYDYSTGKMYAVSGSIGGTGENGTSSLYTIDVATGATEKVGNMSHYFFTLAATYGGDLYGVSKYGDLYLIDKNGAGVTLIGATGIRPTADSSMEFDHTDKTLYWTVNTVEDLSLFCRVDVSTGQAEVLSEMGVEKDASVGGLYIPFVASADDTPSAVTGLNITPAENGACKATLSWTNPSTLFGGGALESLSKVDVYRNGTLVTSLTDVRPGEKTTYEDVISGSTGLLATYKVVPVNENGEGVPSEMTLFVGEDMAGVPANLTLTKDASDAVTLSWEAPATGLNGGWFDNSSLTYNVVRQPDNFVVGQKLTATTISDKNVAKVGSYVYEVTAVTNAGEGGVAKSRTVVLGPQNQLPYQCGFDSDEAAASWLVVDANGDGHTWARSTYNGGCMEYNGGTSYNPFGPADDWLISHDFYLEAGKSYKGTFSQRALANQNLKLYIGQGAAPEELTQLVSDFSPVTSGYVFSQKEYTVTVEKSGYYNLGFHITSPQGASFFYMTDITLEEVADNDLLMKSLSGPKTVVAGKSYDYKVEIENKGVNPAASFKAELVDADQNTVLATVDSQASLPAGETTSLTMSWQPAKEGQFNVKARVVYAQDEIAGNNESQALAVTVRPVGSNDLVEIGQIDDSKYNYRYLFDVESVNSAALNIYSPQDYGEKDGLIEQISFTVKNRGTKAAENVPVKVYMANSDELKVTTWIPEDQMTLVYDGTINIPLGQSEVTIPLSKKFMVEEGKNLAVLTTHKAADREYYTNVTYPYFTTTDESATFYYGSDYTEFDFTNYGNSAWQQKACLTLDMRRTGATLSGKLTDTKNVPLEGAVVTIKELGLSVESDAAGNYKIKFIPDGEYTLTASFPGYVTLEEKLTVAGDESVTRNIQLEYRPSFAVSGKVLTADDKGVSGALVSLKGYEDFSATTAADGSFTIEGVYTWDEPYTMTVTKEWLKPAVQEVNVVDADVTLEDVSMDYLKYRPVSVAVSQEEGAPVVVSWATADKATELRVDDGEQVGTIGVNNASANTVIGTIFREPMVVSKITWYQKFISDYYSMDVYVLALDEESNPTSEVLHKETVRPYEDQWNKLELTTPVVAPNGCLIALGYAGYLGLGTDSGKDVAYPYCNNTHVFAANYTSGEFEYIENRGFKQNLMIRATGKLLADNGDSTSVLEDDVEYPDYSYSVWRLRRGQEESEENWTKLTENPVSELQYSDNVESLEAGVYAYAVRTLLPDGTESNASFSPYIEHDMRTNVTVKVASNSENKAATGAVVTLAGRNYGAQVSETVGENGMVEFTSLFKDVYDLTISLSGYTTIEEEVDFSKQDSYTTEPYELKEIIVEPFNLTIENQEEGNVLFTWNTSGTIEDDFEDYEDFAINDPGKIGWQFVDADEQYTYGFQNIDFPGMTDRMAYIVFNPEATEPSAEGKNLEAHSGKKSLVSFVALEQNDDWIISPELAYAHDFSFSFYARSYAQSSGYQDLFCVGYAEVDNPTTDDFKWLAENVAPTENWSEYRYTVPMTAKHVAIRNVSTSNGFILMLDDLYIGSMPRKQALNADDAARVQTPDVYYEVYLDGEKVGETSEISYLFENMDENAHTAGVKAVYYSGMSEMKTITFGQGGINSALADGVKVYPNPASDWLTVEGYYTRLELTTLSGVCVKAVDGNEQQLNLSDVPAGVYILKVIDADNNSVKIVKVSVL